MADQDQFAYVNATIFQPGDVVIDAIQGSGHAAPSGLAGTVVSFIPILTHGLPGYSVNWVDGTSSDVLAERLRRA